MRFTLDRAAFEAQEPVALARKYLSRHQEELARLARLDGYYRGRHPILDRAKDGGLANNRLVCNHARYITDMSVGYLVGNPVSYAGDGMDAVIDMLQAADASTEDLDLAKDASIFGRAYELVYMSDGETAQPRLACLDPRTAFVIYDDTVERRPLMGVHYYPTFDERLNLTGYRLNAYTMDTAYAAQLDAGFGLSGEAAAQPHYFGAVPLHEISNNEEQLGDFEPVLSLIDAYNVLQADRVNDKEQFADAIMVLTGAGLGDTEEESGEAQLQLKRKKLLELPADGRAEYLTRQFDEASVEVLKTSLESDIHKFSMVPKLTDQDFAGQASGVAIKYKLLGFEQLALVKERYFREGLRYRLRLLAAVARLRGGSGSPEEGASIAFTRNLPANLLELAQTIQALSGHVSEETLLKLLPIVEDPAAELTRLRADKADAARLQRESFGALTLGGGDDR